MKVLIQNVLTDRYLGEKGRWVRSDSEARNFGTSLQAIDFCFNNQLFEVEILLIFQDQRYNIRLNVFPGARKRHSCERLLRRSRPKPSRFNLNPATKVRNH
jgi:hypothetical protein